MDFLKKHADTAFVLSALFSCMLWMNGKFNTIDGQFKDLDKEISIVKTVLIMKGIMPSELAVQKHELPKDSS